jgi:hypothetical protein
MTGQDVAAGDGTRRPMTDTTGGAYAVSCPLAVRAADIAPASGLQSNRATSKWGRGMFVGGEGRAARGWKPDVHAPPHPAHQRKHRPLSAGRGGARTPARTPAKRAYQSDQPPATASSPELGTRPADRSSKFSLTKTGPRRPGHSQIPGSKSRKSGTLKDLTLRHKVSKGVIITEKFDPFQGRTSEPLTT